MFGDQYWVICRSSQTKAVSLCLRYGKQQKLTSKCSRVPHWLTWTPFLSVSTAASPYLYLVWWPSFKNWKGTLSQLGTNFAHWSLVWMYTPCLYLCTYVSMCVHMHCSKTLYHCQGHHIFQAWNTFLGAVLWHGCMLYHTQSQSLSLLLRPQHSLWYKTMLTSSWIGSVAWRELGQAGLPLAIEPGTGWPKSL